VKQLFILPFAICHLSFVICHLPFDFSMSVSEQNVIPDTTASSRNRIAWLYGAIAVVALIGLVDAGYLTIEHLSGRSLQCTIIAGCDVVLASKYSKAFGVPVSLLGAIAYFVVFSIATLIAFDYTSLKIPLLIIVAIMALTSIWLIYLQAFVIGYFCQYCLLSAATSFTLFALTIVARVSEKRKVS
jgi:uncharacterized membrane protein